VDDADGQGDWRAWWARHGAALVLLARQYARTRQDAEDAVQDGFARFWKARGRARQGAGYLFACVRTAAIDLGRRRATRERHERAAPPGGLFTGPPELDERRARIEEALAKLPAEQREVLVLKVWGGLTFAEAGLALGVAEGTAASRYRYALRRLQAVMTREVICE
jgi:RNA polymerase sigma-70 factor (ECF subfamily)